ncbi:Flp pilus assembly protein CpaB [Sphingobium bisphenolivorans]|uniref:Flp pilus assembly protein CpaB n=1 Tax=Sphingobium bisphenolivorans TaxID=1335760 RepID=UPI0003A3CD0F|nr:Flp pilus assembly protein CpaB [Sphingobium bisphenolivorans]
MRLGSRAKLTIAVGLIAAALFMALGVRELRRASAAEPPAERPAPAAPVIVLARAAQAIRTGETISPTMIRSAAGDPARFPTIATAPEVAGKVAARDIAAGALIPREALGSAANLAIRVPVGLRAVSIDTTAEIAVAGLVRPGDRVDVQVVYPGADAIGGARGSGRSRAQSLLQLVPVLAVGDAVVGAQQASGELASPAPPARTVTLALTPDQVSVLSLAKSTGTLTLSLRNPADADRPAVAIAASAGIEPTPAPAIPVLAAPTLRAPPQAAPRRTPHAIELVVGDRRETIYSGSAPR